MKIKRPNADRLEKYEKIFDEYVNWLEYSGRLTPEECIKLINTMKDYIDCAIDFGYSGESA